MANKLTAFTEKLASNPRKMFLLDSIGALITSTLLIVIVIPYHQAFGVPQTALYGLSVIALVFSFYSFCCWYIKSKQWPLLLRILSGANLVYCIQTIVLLIYFSSTLTQLGFFYFAGEVIIILNLVILEIWIVRRAG